jgi:4-hydroxy-tetrahydrodipicolinate reductase
VGQAATRDVDALLKLETDCVVYTGADWYGGDEVVEEVCRILRAGINVTGSSPTTMLLPSSAPDTAARVEAACKEGGSSFFITGISPGFMDDYLPTKLVTGCVSFDRIETEEIFCILPFYDDPSLINLVMGMGNAPDVEDGFRETRLEWAEFVWKASPLMCAEAMNVEIDEVEVDWEYVVTDKLIESGKVRIEPGCVAAVHISIAAKVDGVTRIKAHHYARCEETLAPHWPQPPGTGGYRITITGEPGLTAEVAMDGGTDSPMAAANYFTGARIANTIPVVCAASPGIHTFRSLPYDVTGHTNWRQPK